MEILGLSVGELILMKYDLLAFLPESLSSFESIIFDYKPTKSGMPTKGELFLTTLGLNPHLSMAEVYVIVEDNFGSLNRNLLEGYATILGYGPSTQASIVLDDIFSQLVRQDFHLVRNYTVT